MCYINDQTCIIMPYYGNTIYSLQDKFYFNKLNIKKILKQILEATKYLHDNNIIHRDLSSNNILIDCNEKITIIDFGLSKIQDINSIYNFNVYTLPYRAPEIILENKYDNKIDIWAIGCILGEMLLNNILFEIYTEDDEKNINTIFKFIGTPKHLFKNNKNIINIKNYTPSIEYFINQFDDVNLSDLFIKLLKFNPEERISAEKALLHPYFD